MTRTCVWHGSDTNTKSTDQCKQEKQGPEQRATICSHLDKVGWICGRDVKEVCNLARLIVVVKVGFCFRVSLYREVESTQSIVLTL